MGNALPIFDIPASKLTDLSDEDLRELIARLCEAERERKGGYRSEVRWGGDQNAPDGGIDITVKIVENFEPTPMLARRVIGIQVKKPDLSATAITREMRPDKVLRPAISRLADQGGAYVIASARANCADSALRDRKCAMKAAVADDPNGAKLHLEFLDQQAIGRWVSSHPSVATWLRERLGLHQLTGWRPFGRWSSTPAGESDELICADGLSFDVGYNESIGNIPDALDRMRHLVRDGRNALRIIGLSGIGKSRIVQALFEKIGNNPPLPASHAVYADLSDDPAPAPAQMLDALTARNDPAILIIDNCPPETHRQLAEALTRQETRVSLITVEYDVRTDQPETTDVVRIKAEGPDIVESLLRRRHPGLSPADARRLAELAQGNARLGIALANAAPRKGTLSAFDDASLFKRLFWQRDRRDDKLARAAEAFSLVYSFDVEGEEQPDELTFLGTFAELSRRTMYRQAATLRERGLAQARGRWRAVLPHALANRLAQQALQKISWCDIADEFADKTRLRRSLARRLAYLHDSEEACRIIDRWTEIDGPLHAQTMDFQLFGTCGHLIPDKALEIIREVIGENRDKPDDPWFSSDLERLRTVALRVAHSETYFARACECLFGPSLTADGQCIIWADKAPFSLFWLYLSGTMAGTDARIRVAEDFLQSDDPARNRRGIGMLLAALETDSWISSYLFRDDARPESSGWAPDSQKEIVGWYTSWLSMAARVVLSQSSVSDTVRSVLAKMVGRIWRAVPQTRHRIYDIARRLHAAKPWPEGRQAFRWVFYVIDKRGETIAEAERDGLKAIIEALKAVNLVDRVREELALRYKLPVPDGDHAAAEEQRAQRLVILGRELAESPEDLVAIAPELFEFEGLSLHSLGFGLAEGTKRPEQIWEILRDHVPGNLASARRVEVLIGFLHGLDETRPDVAGAIRAECRRTPALRHEYGLFLPAGVLSSEEFFHIVEIISEAETDTWSLSNIVWRDERQLDDEQRVALLRALQQRPDGARRIMDSLDMLRFVQRKVRSVFPDALCAIAIDALEILLQQDEIGDDLERKMSEVIASCVESDRQEKARRIADALVLRAQHKFGSTYDIKNMLAIMFQYAPIPMLDRFFPDETAEVVIKLRDDQESHPMMKLDPEALVRWCRNGEGRWTRVAAHVPILPYPDRGEKGAETITSLARVLVDAAPDPADVVEAFLENIVPTSWSDSRADIVEARLNAIESLRNHPDKRVASTIDRLAPAIREWIDKARNEERTRHREQDQSFE